MSIIVLEDYKAYSNILNPAQDDKLSYIIDFVNQYITNFCSTSFEPKKVEGLKTTSSNSLDIILPEAPIISIEEIREGTTVVDPASYILDKESGIVESLESFSTKRFGIEVDYTDGYNNPPADIVLSALEWVTQINKGKFSKSKNIGGESVDFGTQDAIPPHIKLALTSYRVL